MESGNNVLFKDLIKFIDKGIIENIVDEDAKKETMENILSFKKRTMKKVKTPEGKLAVNIVVHSLISKYFENDKFTYKISNIVFSLLEIMTNVKFIILDRDNKISSFSVYGEYMDVKEDLLVKLRELFVGKETDPQKLSKIESRISKITEYFENYNPSTFIFVQKVDSRYFLIDSSVHKDGKIELNDMDDELVRLIGNSFSAKEHEYSSETQMAALKMKLDEISKIVNEPNVNDANNGVNNDENNDEQESEDNNDPEPENNEDKPDEDEVNNNDPEPEPEENDNQETKEDKTETLPPAPSADDMEPQEVNITLPPEAPVEQAPKPKIKLRSSKLSKLKQLDPEKARKLAEMKARLSKK